MRGLAKFAVPVYLTLALVVIASVSSLCKYLRASAEQQQRSKIERLAPTVERIKQLPDGKRQTELAKTGQDMYEIIEQLGEGFVVFPYIPNQPKGLSRISDALVENKEGKPFKTIWVITSGSKPKMERYDKAD